MKLFWLKLSLVCIPEPCTLNLPHILWLSWINSLEPARLLVVCKSQEYRLSTKAHSAPG